MTYISYARITDSVRSAGDIKNEVVSEDDDATYNIVYTPRGVVGGITPWNFPVAMVRPLLSETRALSRQFGIWNVQSWTN